MGSQPNNQLDALECFLSANPGIPHALRSSPVFTKFKGRTSVYTPAIPLAIVCPLNAGHVSLLVRHFASHGIPFVVRSGGNNLFGKSTVQDAVTIDVSRISYCRVHDSKSLATIGGGIVAGDLINALGKEGLSTATGMVPTVGFTGWSTYGGYGPLSGKYGLGFEQIVAAKVVNCKGDIIEADDELLKGIKGAGGSFGVIVELTIKTYPLKHLLSGQLVFDGTDVDATVRGVFHGIQRLRDQHAPGALCVAPLFLNTPHGRATFCHVMWADEDVETGAKWVEEVSRLAKLERNGVRQTTHGGATEDFGADFAPDGAYGSVDTMSIRAFTDEVVGVIARNVQSMPAQFGTGLAVHVVMRPSSDFLDQSVFDAQEPHYMFEFLHTTTLEERVEETDKWAKKFLAEMQQTDPSNILPSTYISLTPPGGNTLKRIYGANYDFVMSLKKKYDPEGVFKLAVPFSYLK